MPAWSPDLVPRIRGEDGALTDQGSFDGIIPAVVLKQESACIESALFITRNGEGDIVLMLLDTCDRLLARLSLVGKLAAPARDFAAGDRGLPLEEVMGKLLNRY